MDIIYSWISEYLSIYTKHQTEMPYVSWDITIQRILQNDWARPLPTKTWETG